jgi:hypothetical protein
MANSQAQRMSSKQQSSAHLLTDRARLSVFSVGSTTRSMLPPMMTWHRLSSPTTGDQAGADLPGSGRRRTLRGDPDPRTTRHNYCLLIIDDDNSSIADSTLCSGYSAVYRAIHAMHSCPLIAADRLWNAAFRSAPVKGQYRGVHGYMTSELTTAKCMRPSRP